MKEDHLLNQDVIQNISTKHRISNIGTKNSKNRYNREYLLSKSVAFDLNTYLNFKPFNTFNDFYAAKYEIDSDGKNWNEVQNDESMPGTPGVRSIFNKAGSIVIGTSVGDLNIDVSDGTVNNTSEWRISNNVPLMDSPEARKRIRANSGCSVKELVQASSAGVLGRETYSYSDFMYCKYLGKVPNNYLITLRRFPLPVDDYISSIGETSRVNPFIRSQNVESMGCLVGWLGTPGNDMNNILTYSTAMPFDNQSAQWEDASVDADASGGVLNGMAAMFDPTYRQEYMNGVAGRSANVVMKQFFNVADPPYPATQFLNFRDRNKVYGPIDAIKETYIRSDKGLVFNQSFTLTFDYELRSYNGINGRQAFLDLLSNILNVTYTTGTFWGGGYKGGGAHQSNIFSNLNIFKKQGGFSDYIDAFQQDLSNLWGLGKDEFGPFTLKNLWNNIKKIGNQIGGMYIAGKLNAFGRPQKAMVNSLLSPAPVGLWHVTIGNPHHPIMSMGNMILKSTKVEHYGPLGIDDFPTGIRVTCELERGKPRDIRDIEKIYMHGNDRIYTSMGPKVFDMYKNAQDYKGSIGNSNSEISTNQSDPQAVEKLNKVHAEFKSANVNMATIEKELKEAQVDMDSLKSIGGTLQKYFGHKDAYSIYVAAAEQEYGSQKKKTGTAAGDSRNKKSSGGAMTATIH